MSLEHAQHNDERSLATDRHELQILKNARTNRLCSSQLPKRRRSWSTRLYLLPGRTFVTNIINDNQQRSKPRPVLCWKVRWCRCESIGSAGGSISGRNIPAAAMRLLKCFQEYIALAFSVDNQLGHLQNNLRAASRLQERLDEDSFCRFLLGCSRLASRTAITQSLTRLRCTIKIRDRLKISPQDPCNGDLSARIR